MLFKTTTIMACMLISDLDIPASQSRVHTAPAQALSVSIPIDWQFKALIDGAHLTEPKINVQGREIVLRREASAPDFADATAHGDDQTQFHIAKFVGADDSDDYVLTAWRELADGWVVLRAFAQSRSGPPPFTEAWQIFESVTTV